MEVWTPEFLSKLHFSSNKELFDHLKIEALKSGFQLCSRRALVDPYGCFYCHKGRKTNKNTNKCDCKFSFCSMPKYTGDKLEFVIKIDNTLNLEHTNHHPNPQIFIHKFLGEDIVNNIQTLHQSGITPLQIQKVLLNMGIDLISTLQIQSIICKEQVQQFTAETQNLIEYMKANNGYFHPFEIESQDGLTRVALLTIHQSELENIAKYGDVLFIDGTYASLNSRWEIFPITAIITDLNICCCGIMYAATANEHVLTWMLHQLAEHEEFTQRIHTLITDEDHSFINAFHTWCEEINSTDDNIVVNHILCAFHKSKNFSSKLIKYGLNKLQRTIAKEYFNIICYHPNLDFVNITLTKLQTEFGQRVKKYVENHVLPYLSNFARSYISEIECLGYNTTSPAESMNNMLKRSLKSHDISLVESRIEFDRVLSNHQRNIEIKSNTMRHQELFEGSAAVSPQIIKKIQKQIELSSHIVIQLNKKKENNFFAFHEDHPSIVYEINNDFCSCNLITFAGYPCCHIIQLYNMQELEFPIQFISSRWIISENLGNETLSHMQPNDFENQLPSECEYEEDIMEDSNSCTDLESESDKTRYLKIFHKGKELARLASSNPFVCKKVLDVMQNQVNEILNIPLFSFKSDLDYFENINIDNHISLPETETLIEPQKKDDEEYHLNDNFQLQINNETTSKFGDSIKDAIGKPKGAPKKSQKSDIIKCAICTFQHKTEECFFYNEMLRINKENQEKYKDQPGRRCSLCAGLNHQNRSCQLRKKAIEYYSSKET